MPPKKQNEILDIIKELLKTKASGTKEEKDFQNFAKEPYAQEALKIALKGCLERDFTAIILGRNQVALLNFLEKQHSSTQPGKKISPAEAQRIKLLLSKSLDKAATTITNEISDSLIRADYVGYGSAPVNENPHSVGQSVASSAQANPGQSAPVTKDSQGLLMELGDLTQDFGVAALQVQIESELAKPTISQTDPFEAYIDQLLGTAGQSSGEPPAKQMRVNNGLAVAPQGKGATKE